jgi:chromatin segregation and condensation protein Rec8/ScpA/Scc1 (kleisin family)
MIGAIIGAVGGLASGIAGGIKSAKAAKEQQKLIDEQERKNDAWYNRNYYQNYLDSAEAQAAMKRVENTLKKQNQEARATAVVTGATPESVVAQQQANNEILDDVTTSLASQATARKANIDAVNMENQNNIMNMRISQNQANEKGSSQLMENGLGIIGSALSMTDWGKKKGGN